MGGEKGDTSREICSRIPAKTDGRVKCSKVIVKEMPREAVFVQSFSTLKET